MRPLLLLCCWGLLQSAPYPAPKVVKVVFTVDDRREDPGSDTLFYHQRAARAEDFRGSPRRPGPTEAVSFTSLGFDGGSRQYRDTLEVFLVLQVFWVKSASWARTLPPGRHTLEHEQLHFDITRLVAERFRRKVLQMPLTTDDHESRIQYEYLESFREMNHLQEDFDNAVHQGMNIAAQDEWRRWVRDSLRAAGVRPAVE